LPSEHGVRTAPSMAGLDTDHPRGRGTRRDRPRRTPRPAQRHRRLRHTPVTGDDRRYRVGRSASAAESSLWASTSDGPYQLSNLPDTNTYGTPGKWSGPSVSVNSYGSSGRTNRSASPSAKRARSSSTVGRG